jgi:hypothetical protein
VPSGCTFEPEFYLTGEDSAGVGVGEMSITENTEFRPCDYYVVRNISVNLKSCNYSNSTSSSKVIKFSFSFVPIVEKLVPSAVTSIISQGRNLADDVEIYLSLGFVKQGSGYWKGSQTTGRLWTNTFNIQGVISVSLDVKILTGINGNQSPLNIVYYYADGTSVGTVIKNTEYKRLNLKSDPKKTVSRITLVYNVNGTFEVKDLMINIGDVALPYERYATTVCPIPTSITSLDSYGFGFDDKIYNSLDFETMKYHQRVKRRVFTGNEAWAGKGFYTLTIDDKDYGHASKCSYFDFGGIGEDIDGTTTGQFIEYWGDRDIGFVTDIPTLEEWKAHLANLYENGAPLEVVYCLELEIVTDIPEDADINPITITGGDMVIFANEANLDMPNTITYIRKTREERDNGKPI